MSGTCVTAHVAAWAKVSLRSLMVFHINLCDGYPLMWGHIAVLATCWPIGSMSGKDAQNSFDIEYV